MSTVSTSKLPPLGEYFSQLGYVVQNADQVRGLFRSLGVTDFKTFQGGGDDYQSATGESRTAPTIEVSFGTLGTVEIEIIQPLSTGNLYTDFLEQYGPGLHHTGYNIPDPAEYYAQYQRLLDLGGKPMNGRRIESERFNVEFCYFDCSHFQGSVIELTHFF